MKTFAVRFLHHTLPLLPFIIAAGLVLALLAGLSRAAQAQSGIPLPGPGLAGSVQFPPGTGINPGAALIHPGHGYIYIPSDDDVTVVTGTQVVTSFVGLQPRSVQINPGDGYLYMFAGQNDVAVIGGTEVITRVALGYLPCCLALTRVMVTEPASGYVYVAPGLTVNEVLVLRGGQVVAHVPVPLPAIALTADPKGGRVYVTFWQSSRLAVISGTHVIGEVALARPPFQLVAQPSSGYVYASDWLSRTISVISGTTVLNTIALNYPPEAWLANPANGSLYVATRQIAAPITVISGTEQTGTIDLGGHLVAMAANLRTGYAYFATAESDLVQVVSGATVVAALAAVDHAPRVIEPDPDSGRVYVGGSQYGAAGSTLGIISGAQTLATLPLAGRPDYLAVVPGAGDVYVSSLDSQDVTLIRNTTVLGRIRQAAYPLAAEFNPVDRNVYVADGSYNGVQRVWLIADGAIVADVPLSTAQNGPGGPPFPGGAGVLAAPPGDGRVYLANCREHAIDAIQGTQVTRVAFGLWGCPYDLALDPARSYIYAAEVLDGYRLAVMQGNQVMADLPGMPQSLRVKTNPVTGLAYAYGRSNLVHVVRGPVELGVLTMKSEVTDVAFDSQTGEVYVADADGIALVRNERIEGYLSVALTAEGDSFGPLAYDPANGYLYAVDGHWGHTLVLTAHEVIATLEAQTSGPTGISIDPGSGRVLIFDNEKVAIITGTQAVNRLPLPRDPRSVYQIASPRDLAIDSATGTIYATDAYHHRLTLLAPQPDFNLGPVSVPWRVRPGATMRYTLDLVSQLGFAGPVSLSITGWPCGSSGLIEPDPAPAQGSVTVTISVAPDAPVGRHSLYLSGTGNGITHTAWLSLVLAADEQWLPLVSSHRSEPPIEPVPAVWPTRTPWPTPTDRPPQGPTQTPCPRQAKCLPEVRAPASQP